MNVIAPDKELTLQEMGERMKECARKRAEAIGIMNKMNKFVRELLYSSDEQEYIESLLSRNGLKFENNKLHE